MNDSLYSFRSWFSIHGGSFGSSVVLKPEGPFGISVLAPQFNKDTTIVTCPFSLIITKEASMQALRALLGPQSHSSLETWSERQIICSYMSFHRLFPEPRLPQVLRHLPYIRCLPAAEKLLTPLHFSKQELEILKGTNLYGATLDRERDRRAEWIQCRFFVQSINQAWGEAFTWEIYLTALTHLSSRAFPSSILSAKPSLVSTPSTYPVLIPGVDFLNHKRGQPVSWVVSCSEATKRTTPSDTVSILVHPSTSSEQSSREQLEEVFNNYGPKANDELILGYGFSLPDNPDDKMALQIGGTAKSQTWEVGRNARNIEGLWSEVRSMVANEESEHEFEHDIEAASMLLEMTQAKLDGIKTISDVRRNNEIRPEVKVMLQHYIEGQRDILESMLEFLDGKQEAAIEAAREEGIDVVFDENDD
ncbi:SET domain-containing protein [Gyrodon lividus]|nr:SET domain-containing protein [Gyrodon lividus]